MMDWETRKRQVETVMKRETMPCSHVENGSTPENMLSIGEDRLLVLCPMCWAFVYKQVLDDLEKKPVKIRVAPFVQSGGDIGQHWPEGG